MSQSNQAAWLDGMGKQLRVAPSDTPKAGKDEIVIRNRAIAVNPIDWKVQSWGIMVESWPAVLGMDVAGEVIEVGEGVSQFGKGDRVVARALAHTVTGTSHGGYQLFTTVKARITAHLPENVSFEDAVVLPTALDTALVGLNATGDKGMGLPPPSLNPQPSGKTIVLWGGSSSIGVAISQVATAGGVKVISIASKHNFGLCKEAGATTVLDYHDADILEQIDAAVKAAGGEFVGVYDAISEAHSYQYTVPIVERLGAKNFAVVLSPPENVPEGVQVARVFAMLAPEDTIWRDFVGPALASGQLKCLPPPLVVGEGLEAVQTGLDTNKKGVSGKKVVIRLP